jgi:hypothetical protein
MPSSIIDFSAQCGGDDAAAAVMPHFKALKAASRGLRLEGFPFPELAYILRVDGEISQYQLSGPGNFEIDSDGEYLAIDIGILREDRDRIVEAICDAILASVAQIEDVARRKKWKVNSTSIKKGLTDLIARYKEALP